MSRTTSPEACEDFSESLSAFLDGELPFPDALPAVDHMAACEACRLFYLESRELAERLASRPAPPVPAALSRRFEARASEREAAPVRLLSPGTRRRPWAVAAAIAATVVLAFVLSRPSPSPDGAAVPGGVASSAKLTEIVVEGARGRMTDERFVSLLAEILSADRKYHRETERVLRFVLGKEGTPEAEDGDAREAEPGEAGEEGAAEAARPSAPRLPS